MLFKGAALALTKERNLNQKALLIKRFPTPPPSPRTWTLKGIIGNNTESTQTYAILIFPYGRWEDLDRWTLVVIDAGVILYTSATQSENFLFSMGPHTLYPNTPTPLYLG